jgi:hypothetical protein
MFRIHYMSLLKELDSVCYVQAINIPLLTELRPLTHYYVELMLRHSERRFHNVESRVAFTPLNACAASYLLLFVPEHSLSLL